MHEMTGTPASLGAGIGTRPMGERAHARLRAGDQRGQSLLEFALALPVLMLVLTGIFTFGSALNNYLTLTNAVEQGARAIAVSRWSYDLNQGELMTDKSGNPLYDPCAIAATVAYGISPLLSQSAFSFTFVFNGSTYTGASCGSSSATTGAAGNLPEGATAQMTATYPCNLAVYGVNYAPGCTLRAQVADFVQ